MKKTLAFALLTLLVVTGCRPDPRVAELQQRVEFLERTQAEQAESTRKVLAEIMPAMTNQMSNFTALVDRVVAVGGNETVLQTLNYRVAQIEWLLATNPPRARAVAIAPAGIPAHLYQQIAADAALKWPRDFEMQKFTIEEQVKAWRALNGR